jgi:hypothetical protein
MYYPTNEFETLRMLGLIGEIKLKGDDDNRYIRNSIIDNIKNNIGEDVYKKICEIALDNCILIEQAMYDYFLNNNRHDLIKKYLEYTIGSIGEGVITIADLQAGEGKWLRTFKDFIPHQNNDNSHIKLIANELEENRYNQIKADYKYLGSFEDLQLPKESISLLLFNPPYGETNGIRNVRHYLQMTLDRQLIPNYGNIIMVIREDDARDIIDILARNCFVNVMYKTHKEEYDKYKQIVIIAEVYKEPLDETNPIYAKNIQINAEKYLDKLKDIKEFSPRDYFLGIRRLQGVDIQLLMENFKYVTGDKIIISKPDSVWKHIKDLTELKDMSTEKLVLPKSPKQGEIANLLASGQINGTMSIEHEGKTHEHIVVGGVKSLEETEIIEHEDYKETKTLRYSKPYLNILVTKDGKYQVKELGVDSQ